MKKEAEEQKRLAPEQRQELVHLIDDAVCASIRRQNEDVRDGIVAVLREDYDEGILYKIIFKEGWGYPVGVGTGRCRFQIQKTSPIPVYFKDVCAHDWDGYRNGAEVLYPHNDTTRAREIRVLE